MEFIVQTDMENIEDRLRKASMTGSIHELQDDSGAGSPGLMQEPPIFEDLKSELLHENEDEDEELFEDAKDEFTESPVEEVSPTKSQQDPIVSHVFVTADDNDLVLASKSITKSLLFRKRPNKGLV